LIGVKIQIKTAEDAEIAEEEKNMIGSFSLRFILSSFLPKPDRIQLLRYYYKKFSCAMGQCRAVYGA
jgi:hypothetical protein